VIFSNSNQIWQTGELLLSRYYALVLNIGVENKHTNIGEERTNGWHK